MTAARGAAIATTLALILVTVASGPLLPADFTRSGGFQHSLYQGFGAGGGVDVERKLGVAPQSLPARATLARTDDGYDLSVPTAQVRITTGDQPVTVTYRLRLSNRSATWRTTRTVAADRSTSLTLELHGSLAEADRDSYDGTAAVVIEQGDHSFTARDRNVTVEVER